ncbi:hypothetical protein ACROYT_G037106, partial [Oculina patagonica]
KVSEKAVVCMIECIARPRAVAIIDQGAIMLLVNSKFLQLPSPPPNQLLPPPPPRCLVDQDQRIDCGFEAMTQMQCKGKQCCYQDNVPSGVPHCFYSKIQMDGECLVNQDQRIDCGFEGMTQIQCKEKQCCYQDNVPSGVPYCFYNK